LYYDAFLRGRTLTAIGPPLGGDVADRESWRFTAGGKRLRARIIRRDRTEITEFGQALGAPTLGLAAPRSTPQKVRVGTDLSAVFAGTRALLTLQLDNDLQWIHDWVRWHVSAQGTDAVVVYDNGSTSYTLNDLLDAICVPGVRVAAVVNWSFPYGPQGDVDLDLPWDSDFAQYGAIEHARWRLLRKAHGVLSVDIDELVYATGELTAYECAQAAAQGFVRFSGEWTYTDPASPPTRPVHADCRWVHDGDSATADKWCAAPRRLPRGSQLGVHLAHGLEMPPHAPLRYWHMRAVSTHWKIDRSTHEGDSDSYQESALAAAQLRKHLDETAALVGRASAPGVRLFAERARARVWLAAHRGRRFAKRILSDLRTRNQHG